MNNRYYENIFASFLDYHPYMEKELEDWRPRGEWGIRATLKDGSEYDYNISTNTIRRVVDHSMPTIEDVTEERCRASIAYHLMELMAVKGFSQNTLAEYTGLGRGSINNYINGKATPSATALVKIARVLDCNVEDLID